MPIRLGKKLRSVPAVRLVLLIAILAVGVACFLLLPKDVVTDAIEWIRGLGPWGPVALAFIYILACILMLPGFVLTLGAGFLFGVMWGTVAVSVGSVIGATMAFLIGRTLGRGFIERRMANYPKFTAIDRAVANRGFKIVLLVRLSPIIPFNVTNYLFGLTRVRLRDYILASWIGMLPATVTYAYLGSVAKSLHDITKAPDKHADLKTGLLVIGLVATAVVTIYVTRIAQRELKHTIGGSEPSA
jgi:uncharacterized membrane protein YdjX (TVP38/TMEM64 family)